MFNAKPVAHRLHVIYKLIPQTGNCKVLIFTNYSNGILPSIKFKV